MNRSAVAGNSQDDTRELELALAPQPEIFFRYRTRYARRGQMRFLGQLDLTRLFSRAVRRAELPMRYSQGYHPQPKIMYGPAPPVGVASEAEFADIEIIRRLAPEEVAKSLQQAMPEGIAILSVVESPMKAAAITTVITMFDYEVRTRSPGIRFDQESIDRFMDMDAMVISQKREKGDREVDLRPLVKYLTLGDQGRLLMGVRVVEGPGVKPHEVAAAVFGLSDQEARALLITRTDAHFKQAQPVRHPGKGQRVRKSPKGVR